MAGGKKNLPDSAHKRKKKMLQHSPGVVGKATASLGFMPGL